MTSYTRKVWTKGSNSIITEKLRFQLKGDKLERRKI